MIEQKRGITLIALIVTIIVLLILAGVSISMVVGENGIIFKAENAKKQSRVGKIQEYVDLWYAENQIEDNSKTESELLDDLYNDGLITDTEKENWTENGELLIENTKINLIIQTTPSKKTLADINIGDYVDYVSDIATQDELTQVNNYISTYSGQASNTTVTQVTDLKWRVLEIDEDASTITLISEGEAPKFYLYGPTGYSNGVKLLNTVCSILYDNSEIGATSRNLNREDMEPYIARNTNTILGRTYEPYTGSKYYPNIYPLEYSYSSTKKNQIDGVDTTGTLKRSEQIDWVDSGYTGASTSIRPVTSSLTNFTDITEDSHIFTEDIYYELFLKNTNSFWLSTRASVATSTDYTLWCMEFAHSTALTGISLMDVHVGGSAECEIRPIIFLNSNLECLDGDGSYEKPYVILENE